MKREKSCGAVLYRQGDGGRVYLILHSTLGHYTLCKGHVEGDETERNTARREILEETGLTARFLDGFRTVINYSPRPGVSKDVVFFLGELDEGTPVPQPSEVEEIFFLPYEKALARLTHDSDRETLTKAENFLNAMESGEKTL